MVNIMGVDVLTMQGASTSATMILTMLNLTNSVPTRLELTHWPLEDTTAA